MILNVIYPEHIAVKVALIVHRRSTQITTQPFLFLNRIFLVKAHKMMESCIDDLQAINLLKSGDINGLEHLIARYQAKALCAAFLVMQQAAAAEDVVQDAFIRFFQNVRHFDENRPFAPYFMRSVVNLAISTMKKDHSGMHLDENKETQELEHLLSEAVSVEAQVEYAQLKAEIAGALQRLSARQRAVVVQRYFLDMSEKEMAQSLDVAPGTVKWLLNHARNRLRSMIQPEWRKG